MKKIHQIACLLLCMTMVNAVCCQEKAEGSLDRGIDLPVQSAPPGTSETQHNSVRESLPKIIYIFDDTGKLVPWIGSFPWQKYDELEQLSRSFSAPKYVFTKLMLNAVSKEDHAILSTRLSIRILDDGRYVVPVEMGTVHFSKPPSSTGNPVFAQFNDRYGEYELLVEGKAGEEIEVEFESRVPIQRIGPESRLKLSVPRAPVSSLSVLVPATGIEGRLENGLVTSRSHGEGSSKLEAQGLPQQIDLSWRPPLQREADEEVSFEVEGDIEVRVDALGGITSDAVLTVRSFARVVESVIVRLPAGMRWSETEAEPVDYRITPLAGEGASNKLQIVFHESSLNPPSIRLHVKSEGELAEVELAGFDVLGAQAQFGEVRLDSEGNRQLEWSIGEFARRIEKPDLTTPSDASFAYSRTNQLLLTVTKQSTELIVEPIYELVVEETRVTLTATFICGKRGANPPNLVFDMKGWTLPGLGRDPDNVVGYLDELLCSQDGRLELPLVDPPDRFEVSFTATMPLEQNLGRTPGNTLGSSFSYA